MTALLAVVGPTGSGKSSLSLEIVERLKNQGLTGEIVNADSMQFYKGMDVGTAKLSLSERRSVPHHLLDWLEITDESTAAQYQPLARAAIEDIQTRGSLPILVGGSMLYLAAVLNTFEFPARDEELRSKLEADLERVGSVALHKKLADMDSVAASRVDPKNGRRVVRAIEIVMTTGKPFSASLPETFESWQPVLQLGLNSERADLVSRINTRSQMMFDNGLITEVEGLIPKGIRNGKTSSRAIGYAQALQVIDGIATESQAVEETALLTSRYARRQMSWFRRDDRITWLDYPDPRLADTAMELVKRHLETHSQ